MPWYTPWSDHIAKSVCKYLLQRYLGQFLEEKLTLDQLTVDLYKGIGVISDVALDVQALNEVAEHQNIPFEFMDGFIEKMSVSVPWSSILNDASNIEVEGLSLTVRKTEREKARVSMFESMWSSMTSSMQLAEDCLKSEREGLDEDGGHTFEGIESFAHTIDSILSRIKVKFIKTVIRLEEVPVNSTYGVALEINIKLMEYFDEGAIEEEKNAQDFHMPTFSTKKIYFDAVTFYSDEFPVPTLSDSKLNASDEVDAMNDMKSGEGSQGSASVLIGRFAGRQEVTMKFKQDGVEGPKVDLQINLGALTVFLSPLQAHNLLLVVSGMTTSKQGSRSRGKSHCHQKPMEESDFRKIEQELQMNLTQGAVFQSKGLGNQGWASTYLDGSECEFGPLHNSSRLYDSVMSYSSSLTSSVMSLSSRSSHCRSQTPFLQSKRKVHSGSAEVDSQAVVFYFRVMLSSLSVVILHEDVLTLSVDSSRTAIAKSTFEEMRRLAEDFFEDVGVFIASGFGNKDFEKGRDVFSTVCQMNHIRFTAAPVVIEGSETSTSSTSVIRGKCTASRMELLECLLEKENHSQMRRVEYVELLKFKNSVSERKESHHTSARPNVTLNFQLAQTNSPCVEKGRKYIQPKSNFSFELQPLETEVDITIVDRISALLNSESNRRKKSDFSSSFLNAPSRENFQHVVDSHSLPNVLKNIKITSSFVTFKIRFPIPDLRPMHDMDKSPWWKRSVRKDILSVDVIDFTLNTVIDDSEVVSKYEIQFREATVRFKEADADVPVEFAKASTASNCDILKDEGGGFGWPRLVVHLYPKMNPANLEENEYSGNCLKTSSNNLGYQSVVSTLEDITKKEHSPFSCKKVIHESDTPHGKTSCPEEDGEELIIPGDNSEIADFIEVASINTRIKLEVTLPTASVLLPSKHLYEVIYNRISSDLLLWEPSAPVQESNSVDTNYSRMQSAPDFAAAFSLCRSAAHCESDSDSESSEGVFYSVHEQKQRYRKKQLLENNVFGQSKMVLHVTVLQGLSDLYAPVRDAQGNVIPRQHGELHVSFEEGSLFLVSGFKGKPDLDYFCVQVNHFSFYHNGLVSDVAEKPLLRDVGCCLPGYLELTVKKTDKCALVDQSTSVGVGSSTSLNMLTVSVRLKKNQLSQTLKTFRVAVGIREATLRHKVSTGQSSWFTQLIDFFDVTDYPIAGYDPSSVLSEVNVHLWNCAVDYRPLHLPLRCMLTVGNFNISSNIAAQTSSSTLRFIAEDAAFFLSDKCGVNSVDSSPDLRRDYVCVMELGLFELSLRLSEKNQLNPKIDLRASASVAHLWTCSDSARALTELLMYFASDGDLTFNEPTSDDSERPRASFKTENEEQLLVKTGDSETVHSLSKSQVALVNDLMEEAMRESKMVESSERKSKEAPAKIIYYEREKEEGCEKGEEEEEEEESFGLGAELNGETNGFKFEDNWEEEFYIVQNEAGMGMMPKKGLPEVRNLTNTPVRLVDNHFSIPLGKADLLRSPKHYPNPVLRYMLREMSLVWHMYGGSDFDKEPQTSHKRFRVNQNLGNSSPSECRSASETVVAFSKHSTTGVNFKSNNVDSNINWKHRGGAYRRHDVLMELQLNKVRFQHEVYPENTAEASRQVLLIQEVELRDRLATSTINKFLYQYSSESKPKQSQAPMVVVKSVLLRSDPKINAQECCLKVSLLPLRLNIDQDSILFLYRFFTELAGDNKEEVEDFRTQTPKHQVPVMTVNVKGKSDTSQPEPQHLLIDLEGDNQGKASAMPKSKTKGYVPADKTPGQPLFFRCFIFSPEVPVRLDYQGKRVDMSHGSLAGILMGLGQLNNSELKLRKISYRHGLLGFDKLMNFVLSEWANDIKKNQLPSLLGGVGPMHSLVQLIQGIRDLFWLPIEQYQKDGRLVRGFQKGANSFTTSTAMASLELISRLIQIIQATAETAYDMVSPGPSVKSSRRNGKGKSKRFSQPVDIREGMAIAYLLVKEGIGETAETIVRVASEEHEQKGVTGAVGGVLRQIPPTVVKPIILATEATNNVIGGMRSQLVPDARKEAVEKWRRQDL